MISTDCIEPPALDELALSQFADGEAHQNTVAHIANCTFCRANAAQIVAQQQELKSLLFRSTCPPPEELRDFQMSFLARVRDNFVALHVNTCPHCARELALLNAYLDDPLLRDIDETDSEVAADLPSTVLGRLQSLIAELIQPGIQPSLGGIRGGDVPVQTFRAGDGQIGLEVQADDAHLGTVILKGLLTGIDLTDLSIHLWQNEQLIASEPVDELLGDFVVAGLASGDYELTLHGPNLVIRIPSLKIGG